MEGRPIILACVWENTNLSSSPISKGKQEIEKLLDSKQEDYSIQKDFNIKWKQLQKI